jgi:hypothetical protein
VQGSCDFGPTQASNIIILDTPCGDFIEVSSSSYNLSLFSLKAGSDHGGGAGAAPRESYNTGIGDLWHEIDSLRGADHEGTFTIVTHCCLEASTLRPLSGAAGGGALKKRKIKESMRDATKNVVLEQAPGPSSTPPKGCGGGSAKSKATQILTDTTRDILPRMKRSFAERQYLPSTSMDRSEWELILKQLIIMSYVVKEEAVSETDD